MNSESSYESTLVLSTSAWRQTNMSSASYTGRFTSHKEPIIIIIIIIGWHRRGIGQRVSLHPSSAERLSAAQP